MVAVAGAAAWFFLAQDGEEAGGRPPRGPVPVTAWTLEEQPFQSRIEALGTQLGRALQVRLDPAKIVRAQCFVPNPLELVIASARGRLWRSILAVQIDIVMPQFQRKTIGEPACFGHLLRREIASRQGNAEVLA